MTFESGPTRSTDVERLPSSPAAPSLEVAESFGQSAGPRRLDRLAALGEVILCSGFPTQFFLVIALAGAGLAAVGENGDLSLAYIMTLSFADAAIVIGLVLTLLRLHGQSARSLFLGRRPYGREAFLGLLLVPVAIGLVLSGLGFVQQYAPWLRNVPENPLKALIQTPRDTALFVLVAIVAGGLREELQRAFILDRFERHLGGGVLGLVLFSIAFGAGHTLQGWDAAILTGLLGALWGAVYLARRSIVAPVVCHAGFNLAEIVRHLSMR